MKQITNQDSVSAFSLTLPNNTSNVKNFRMFDADGVVSAIQGAKTSTTTGTITPSAIYNTTIADSLLLTIDERFIIDSQTAVEVSVATTNDVTLTFFVEGFLS